MNELKALDFQDLTLIHYVTKYSHLTLAAERMYMSQPAASHRLKVIEEKLGLKVFNKMGNKFSLSKEGEYIHELYYEYTSLLNKTKDKITSTKNLVSGSITIGSSDTIALYILPRIIKSFRQRYPHVKISLTSNPSKVVAKQLLEGKIDIGIALTNSLSSQFNIIPLFSRKDIIIVSSENFLAKYERLPLKDLVMYDFITLDELSQSRYFILDWFKERNINIKIGMELASIEMVKKYVELDYGFSIVPEFSVENEINEKRLKKIEIADDLNYGLIAAFTSKKRYISTATNAFIQMIEKYNEKNMFLRSTTN